MKAYGYCHFNENGGNRSFEINLFNKDLTIQQIPGDRLLGHGAVVWDASVILVKYMEKNIKDYDYHKLNGKKVIELGSGCGLGGIAFMMKGAIVTFTDLKNVIEKLTIKNVENIYTQLKLAIDIESDNNIIYHKPNIYPIDWTESSKLENDLIKNSSDTAANTIMNQFDNLNLQIDNDNNNNLTSVNTTITTTLSASKVDNDVCSGDKYCLISNNGFKMIASNNPYDIILLTDCVFAIELVYPLVQTILYCCGLRSIVLCCHEIRDEDANNEFIKELSKYFSIKKIPMNKLHDDYKNDMVEIFQAKLIRKKN